MSRQKKSRKMGQLGARKADSPKPVKIKDLSKKKRKGLPKGSRYSQENDTDALNADGQPKKDPRQGSKKPIDLHAIKKVTVEKTTPSVNQQPKAKIVKPKDTQQQETQWRAELAKIEQDETLMVLLDRYENEETLTAQELTYMNKLTSKHAALLEKLGISDEDDDLYEQWEQSDGKGDW